MRYAVVDTNYAHERYRGMAATWLDWELQRLTAQVVPARDADILLATVSSQQGVSGVRKLRKATARGQRIVLGGGGAYAPAVFDPYVDAICVGEGQRFIHTLVRDGWEAALSLPECWVAGDLRPVVPNADFPWDIPPVRHPDGTVRLFASRGCRHKCLFCQTGFESRYRTNPNPNRLRGQAANQRKRGASIVIVTNDGADEAVRLAGRSKFLSARADNLMRMDVDRTVADTVRIGVEGVSERLRRAAGKPISTDSLLSVTAGLLSKGVGVRYFFVCGLPGETVADYKELRGLVTAIAGFPKGCVMATFHAFIPQPATPLCVLPLRDEYWEPFDEFRRWFFHGPGFTRRFQIVAPARYAGRLQRAKESMAATEDELRRGWFEHDNRNWRVQYPFSPDKLRIMARSYARRVGFADAVSL